MRTGWRAAVILLIANFVPMSAWAQSCTFGISALNFSQVDTLLSAPTNMTATMSVNCTGVPLSRILICPNIGSGSGGATAAARQMLNGANALNFQLYSDNTQSTVWGSYTWPFPARPPALAVTLGALGSATGSRTIYGSVFGGQGTAPPGSYLSSFSGSHTEFRYRYTSSSDCSTLTGTVARPSFNVMAAVAGNCRVSTQAVDFGTTGVLSSNVDATGQVAVSCTPGTIYSVSLGNGGTGNGPTSRRMILGSQGITYGLYRDAARSLPWGNTIGTNTVPA